MAPPLTGLIQSSTDVLGDIDLAVGKTFIENAVSLLNASVRHSEMLVSAEMALYELWNSEVVRFGAIKTAINACATNDLIHIPKVCI